MASFLVGDTVAVVVVVDAGGVGDRFGDLVLGDADDETLLLFGGEFFLDEFVVVLLFCCSI